MLFLADAETGGATKHKRDKKEPFRIDFITPAEKDLKTLSKELFVGVSRGVGINLPGTSANAKTRKGKKGGTKEKEKDLHLLPDDMHFSSRQLVTLFLKPKFSVRAHVWRDDRALMNFTPPAQNARPARSLDRKP